MISAIVFDAANLASQNVFDKNRTSTNTYGHTDTLTRNSKEYIHTLIRAVEYQLLSFQSSELVYIEVHEHATT